MLISGAFAGLMFVAHGGWSTREWVQQHKALGVPPPMLPRDIVVEILVGLAIMILAAVAGVKEELRPLALAEEHSKANEEGQNPYAQLETRPNFQDLVGRRKTYLEWRRQEAAKEAKEAEAMKAETKRSEESKNES